MTSKSTKPPVVSPGELLEMWMGEPLLEGPPRRARRPLVWASTALAVTVATLLAKYAADVLLIAVALAGTGLLLHVLGTWLAESDILSPGWFLILVLAGVLGAWALFYPADGLYGLGRYVPKPVARFFEWTESRGWGQRVFFGPGGLPPAGGGVPATGTPAATPGATEPAPPSPFRLRPAGNGTELTLTASRTSARRGEPVGLTARFDSPGASPPAPSVAFYDGVRLLGRAPVVREGQVWVASLTVRDLAPGNREITAVAPGGLPGASTRSAPLRISVSETRE